MRCYKCDGYGESACEHAKCNPMMGCFECTNPCVLLAEKAMREAEQKSLDAVLKLRKYREAVRPIVENCRAIIEAYDKWSDAANETKEDNR